MHPAYSVKQKSEPKRRKDLILGTRKAHPHRLLGHIDFKSGRLGIVTSFDGNSQGSDGYGILLGNTRHDMYVMHFIR